MLGYSSAGGGKPAGSSGQVQFNNSGAFGANSKLFWNNSNNELGVGTSSPNAPLTIQGVTDNATLNANLLVNRNPNNATYWTAGTGWTTTATTATATAATGTFAATSAAMTVTTNTPYLVSFRILITSGGITVSLGGFSMHILAALAVTNKFAGVATSTAPLTFTPDAGGFTGTLSAFSTTASVQSITPAPPTLTFFDSTGTDAYEIRNLASSQNSFALGTNAAEYATNLNTNAVIIGGNAGQFLEAGGSVAIGVGALQNNVGGSNNIAVGSSALNKTLSSDNIAIGGSALTNAVGGQANTAIGFGSLQQVTSGAFNMAMGYLSGGVTTGSSNILLGYEAGNSLQTGSSNVLIGNSVTTPSASTSNYLSIGNVYYGNTSTFAATTTNNTLDDGSGNVTVAGKINITTGTNKSAGTGTLSGGTATISTTVVTASSLVFLTDTSNGVNIGILSVGTITAGTSFVVNSSNALDTSTFNWLIIN